MRFPVGLDSSASRHAYSDSSFRRAANSSAIGAFGSHRRALSGPCAAVRCRARACDRVAAVVVHNDDL